MDWEWPPQGPTTSDSNDPQWEGKAVRRHRHRAFELAVVLEGDGFVEADRWSRPVTEGSVIWIAPGVEHAMRRTSRLMALATVHAGKLSPCLSHLLPAAVFDHGIEVTRISDLALKDFWALYANCQALLPDEARIAHDQALWMSWLNVLLAFVQKQAVSTETVQTIAQIADQLTQHPGADITVAEMARRAGFSEAHFRKLFHELYHTSPKTFQAQARIEAAKARLQTSRKPVADIADRLGFESPAAFSTWFRKMTGMTPSAFRGQSLGTPEPGRHRSQDKR